ncbi:hypothetical protein ACMFMG_001752 [Clarireedia jacksonii]
MQGARQTASMDEDVEMASASRDIKPMTRKRKADASPELLAAKRNLRNWKGKDKEEREKAEEAAEGEGEPEGTEMENDKLEASSTTTVKLAEALQITQRRLAESNAQWNQFAKAAERIGVYPGAGFRVLKETTERLMKVVGAYLLPGSIPKENLESENPPKNKRRREYSPVDLPAKKMRDTTNRSMIPPELKENSPRTPSAPRERHEGIYPLEKLRQRRPLQESEWAQDLKPSYAPNITQAAENLEPPHAAQLKALFKPLLQSAEVKKEDVVIDLISENSSTVSRTEVQLEPASKSPTVRGKVHDGFVELAIGDGRAAEAFGGAVLGDTERSVIIEILSSTGSKESNKVESEPDLIPGPLNWDHEYMGGVIDGNRGIRNSIMAGGAPPPLFGKPLVVLSRAQARIYPFMGNIRFRSVTVPGNGNCFFNTISLLLYGTTRYWNHVKGAHYWFFREVLLDEDHPRHAMYTYLNGMQHGGDNKNLWEALSIPEAWQSGDLFQVTADIYGLFIVTYEITRFSEPVVNIYGDYNSRHVFCHIVGGNHWQPLWPTVDPSEVIFPYPDGVTVRPKPGRMKTRLARNAPLPVPIQRPKIPRVSDSIMARVLGFNMGDGSMDLAKFSRDRDVEAEQLSRSFPALKSEIMMWVGR